MMTKQTGAALFVSLILLMVLMIIGVTAVRNSSFQEKMATNVHQMNAAYGASQAGIGALNNIANQGNDLDASHLLFRARVNGNVDFCVDPSGDEATCGSVYLDNNATKAEVSVVNQGCVQQLCFGFSLGEGTNNVQCLVYQVDSEGDAYGVTDDVEWWAFQITAQC